MPETATRSSDYETTVRAHAAFFARLLAAEGPKLNGGGKPDGGNTQLGTLHLLAMELENLETAFETAMTMHSEPVLAPLARWLPIYLTITGRNAEGRELGERLTVFSGEYGPVIQREIISSRAAAFSALGDYARALELYGECLSTAEDDLSARADVLNVIGNTLRYCRDFEAARSRFEEALALNRQLGRADQVAGNLHNLGVIADYLGDRTSAKLLLLEAMAINRSIGNLRWEAYNLNSLGVVAMFEEDYALARDLMSQSLATKLKLGDLFSAAMSLTGMTDVDCSSDRFDLAADDMRRCLRIRLDLGDRPGLVAALVLAAWVLQGLGEAHPAALIVAQLPLAATNLGLVLSERELTRLQACRDNLTDALAALDPDSDPLPLEELARYVLDRFESLSPETPNG